MVLVARDGGVLPAGQGRVRERPRQLRRHHHHHHDDHDDHDPAGDDHHDPAGDDHHDAAGGVITRNYALSIYLPFHGPGPGSRDETFTRTAEENEPAGTPPKVGTRTPFG
jgi:hypothetical protein